MFQLGSSEMTTEETTLVGIATAALTVAGIYIKSRIMTSDDEKTKRLTDMEAERESRIKRLEDRLSAVEKELDTERRIQSAYEGFRLALVGTASAGAPIPAEVIIQLDKMLESKISDLNSADK